MDLLTQASLVAASAVLIGQQILKLKIIPIGFANRYPVPTNLLLSVVATIIVTNWTDITWEAGNWDEIVRILTTISVGAAIAYNQLFGKWPELKASEGAPTK